MDRDSVQKIISDILMPYWSYYKESNEMDQQAAKRAFVDVLIIITNSKAPMVHEEKFCNGFAMFYLKNLSRLYYIVKLRNYISACRFLSDTLDLYWTEDMRDGLKVLLEEIQKQEPELFWS